MKPDYDSRINAGLSKEEIANNRSTDKIFLPSVCEELRLSRIKGWNKAVKYSYGWAKNNDSEKSF